MNRLRTSPGATCNDLARLEEPDGATVRGPGSGPYPSLDRRLAVAPMLDYTDRHARYLLRLLSRRTLLYSEMVTTGALLHAEPSRFLDHDPFERPVALQLGGSDPGAMAACARLGERWGYAEINMNVGCPSDRVQSGAFGACLMVEPGTVAGCVRAMRDAVAVPVTVKTRIGVDHRDSYEALAELVGTVAEAGCHTFVLHARKAWLKGLSPAQNRTVPPLRYDVVYRLKQDFPRLEIVLNGGVTSLEAAHEHLRRVDGVMIGRAACDDPYLLAGADRLVFGEATPVPSREEVLERYALYVEDRLAAGGVPLVRMTRHLLGLFHGQPGARAWRRHLTVEAARPGATPSIIREAARFTGGTGISPVDPGRRRQTPGQAATGVRPYGGEA